MTGRKYANCNDKLVAGNLQRVQYREGKEEMRVGF
jgi:hypothetical protein